MGQMETRPDSRSIAPTSWALEMQVLKSRHAQSKNPNLEEVVVMGIREMA
jgi:hypothetical protein